MDAARVAYRMSEIVRTERDDGFMAGDVLRALHGDLGCGVSAFHLSSASLGSDRAAVAGAPEERLDQYRTESAGLVMDPLVALALARRAPVHDQGAFGDAWVKHPFHAMNARRFGTEHYLVIPILGARDVVGTLHMSRMRHARPFRDAELHLAALVGAHLSVALSVRASSRVGVALAFREMQVARLAASGLDNGRIAERLGLARETVKKTLGRAYAKLGVRSRAEMAAKLARSGRL